MARKPLGKLNHIGIAVRSIAEARKFFEEILGATVFRVSENRSRGFNTCEMELNGSLFELIEPADENSFVEKFLEKRGEGLHHLTFEVDAAKSKVAELKRNGIRIVDEIEWSPTSFEAFISPKSAHGVVIQLGSGSPTLVKKDSGG